MTYATPPILSGRRMLRKEGCIARRDFAIASHIAIPTLRNFYSVSPPTAAIHAFDVYDLESPSRSPPTPPICNTSSYSRTNTCCTWLQTPTVVICTPALSIHSIEVHTWDEGSIPMSNWKPMNPARLMHDFLESLNERGGCEDSFSNSQTENLNVGLRRNSTSIPTRIRQISLPKPLIAIDARVHAPSAPASPGDFSQQRVVHATTSRKEGKGPGHRRGYEAGGEEEEPDSDGDDADEMSLGC
ncbi:hypothetical protein BKA70DRAFT_1404606 [Coprinopsis sp. MPI-PUGE-AT-0042]|nr:hypothetical protein BKA70DRAFT_1404606 [Coprinopsis sp. MPI-PUGE-AT-0042]